MAERITVSVLNAGCGTGDTALFLGRRGCQVTGIDFIEKAIRRAKQKAAERDVQATFMVKDATMLKDWSERFGNVIDSGLFHVFSDEDHRRYVEGLATILKLEGRLFLMCFSDEEPGEQGPRRVSKKELHAAFAEAWDIESVESSRYEIRPDLKLWRLEVKQETRVRYNSSYTALFLDRPQEGRMTCSGRIFCSGFVATPACFSVGLLGL